MLSEISKWNAYQKERFPLVKYSALVAAFSASGLSLSYLLTGSRQALTLEMFLVAFTVTLLTFFQLRVADEHKDSKFDAIHHPERPVPRGLVTLKQLRILAVLAAIVQLALAFLLSGKLLLPLILTWSYMYLMEREFFAANWLRDRPVLYMVSHMCILFFTDLFIASCHFLVSGIEPPVSLMYFLGTSFFLGTVIELGRKIRSPQDESDGPDTYSKLWGRETAVKTWLAAMALSGLFAVATATQIQGGLLALIVLTIMLCISHACGRRFLMNATPTSARRIDTISGAWTLTTYLMIGLVPMLLSSIKY